MDMNRKRPPKNCEDLALWLSGTVNDAIRDVREAGLSSTMIASIVLSLGSSEAYAACMKSEDLMRIVLRHKPRGGP